MNIERPTFPTMAMKWWEKALSVATMGGYFNYKLRHEMRRYNRESEDYNAKVLMAMNRERREVEARIHL